MPKRENSQNIFFKTLEWITRKLDELKIMYMITGGSSVGFWGEIRTTMDIDIVIQLKKNDLQKLYNSLKKEAYADIDYITEQIKKDKMFNVIYHETSFKIDFIPLKNDVYEKNMFSNKKKIYFHGKDINVISPEDLIISKLIWNKKAGGSERQINDCKSIYILNQDKLDLTYLQVWINKLGLTDDFQKIQ